LDATLYQKNYAVPAEHRPKIRSTNPLERFNREIGRRIDVVGIFPDDASLIRLVSMLASRPTTSGSWGAAPSARGRWPLSATPGREGSLCYDWAGTGALAVRRVRVLRCADGSDRARPSRGAAARRGTRPGPRLDTDPPEGGAKRRQPESEPNPPHVTSSTAGPERPPVDLADPRVLPPSPRASFARQPTSATRYRFGTNTRQTEAGNSGLWAGQGRRVGCGPLRAVGALVGVLAGGAL
jgi:hypothetical protein